MQTDGHTLARRHHTHTLTHTHTHARTHARTPLDVLRTVGRRISLNEAERQKQDRRMIQSHSGNYYRLH